MLPWFGVFDNIAFQVNGDTFTLNGQVTRPTLKSDAENVVKHIEGVQHVINKIEVLPSSPMDDQLRLALYRAIYGYPPLEVRLRRAKSPSASSSTGPLRCNTASQRKSQQEYRRLGPQRLGLLRAEINCLNVLILISSGVSCCAVPKLRRKSHTLICT
jgi:hypothetical protein